MTTQNKKIAMYFGGAILVGAVGYFVYSFFQTKTINVPLGDTSVTIGEEKTTTPSLATPSLATPSLVASNKPTNVFTDLLKQDILPIDKLKPMQFY
jgi:hypothetical protein